MFLEEQVKDIYGEAYNSLSIDEKAKLYALFQDKNTLNEYREKIEKLLFYHRPPTPEEFLDPKNGWVPYDTPETMYPWVRKEFIDILTPDPTKEILVEYGATRLGKTFLAVHLMLYTIIYFHCLREPSLFYGLSS